MVSRSSHGPESKSWSGGQVMVWWSSHGRRSCPGPEWICEGNCTDFSHFFSQILRLKLWGKYKSKSQVKSQDKVLKLICVWICAGSINSPVKSSRLGQVSIQILRFKSWTKHNSKFQVKSQVKVPEWICAGICAGQSIPPVKSTSLSQVSSQIPKREKVKKKVKVD